MQLAVSLAKKQHANGDMFLIEQPLLSEALKETCLRDLEESDDTYVAISDMCRLGLVHHGVTVDQSLHRTMLAVGRYP